MRKNWGVVLSQEPFLGTRRVFSRLRSEGLRGPKDGGKSDSLDFQMAPATWADDHMLLLIVTSLKGVCRFNPIRINGIFGRYSQKLHLSVSVNA